MPISGFVITFNRAELLATCLRSIRFVDELIVIDKSSTDDTRRIARCYADRVITVPWTPTVEETRDFALQQCHHDWVAFLDDDEMFSPEAIEYLHAPRSAEGAAVIALPRRHWILGAFDANAYYWPEHQIRCFRKGAVVFGPTVHGGIELRTNNVEQIPATSSIYIEHLSHVDAAQWIERTNRYTSRPARISVEPEGVDIIEFAHRRIDYWLACSRHTDRNDYAAAVALLRAIYDMVDRIKQWEQQRGTDSAATFRARCTGLERAYDELESRLGIPTGMHARGWLQRLTGWPR